MSFRAIAAASADPTRIDDVRHYGERDMPVDARRPVDAAVASIKLNERVKAGAPCRHRSLDRKPRPR